MSGYIPPHLRQNPSAPNSRPSSISIHALASSRQWSKHPSSSNYPSPALLSNPGDIKPKREGTKAWRVPGEMEMLGTVSRSGGLGDEGDALKDEKTQEKFWAHINTKLDAFNAKFPLLKDQEIPSGSTLALEMMNNILLLLRKLREGIMASHRTDKFAIQVYETSVLLSIQASNHPQLISSLSVLAPGMYKKYDDCQPSSSRSDKGEIPDLSTLTISDSAISLPRQSEEGEKDRRGYFISLLLLYQIAHLSSPSEFNRIYFSTTAASPSLVSPTDPNILLSLTACKSLTSPLPHSFSKLYNSPTLATHQKILLSHAIDPLRSKTWDVLRSSYLSVPVQWAGEVLMFWEEGGGGGGDEWEDGRVGELLKWVNARGGRVEGGKVFMK